MDIIAVFFSVCLVNADFPVCTEIDYQQEPTPVFANGQYYVFWPDYRFGSMSYQYILYGARISADGTVLDPGGKWLFADTVKAKAEAAFDGTNIMAVFRNGC